MVIYSASHKCAFFVINEDIVCLLVLISTTLTVAFRRISGTFHVSSCIGSVSQYTYRLPYLNSQEEDKRHDFVFTHNAGTILRAETVTRKQNRVTTNELVSTTCSSAFKAFYVKWTTLLCIQRTITIFTGHFQKRAV